MISVTQEDVKIFTVNIVNRTLQKEAHPIGLYLKMEHSVSVTMGLT